MSEITIRSICSHYYMLHTNVSRTSYSNPYMRLQEALKMHNVMIKYIPSGLFSVDRYEFYNEINRDIIVECLKRLSLNIRLVIFKKK